MTEPTGLRLAAKSLDTALEATQPLIQRLLGPIADEAGQILTDIIRPYRVRSMLRVLDRTRRMLREAGMDPGAVQLGTLVPLLEAASLEDDEDLSSMWAGLLASAASQECLRHKNFVGLLRDMSPIDARVLVFLYEIEEARGGVTHTRLSHLFEKLEYDDEAILLSTINLMRLQLCSEGLRAIKQGSLKDARPSELKPGDAQAFMLNLTLLGVRLVEACRGPS